MPTYELVIDGVTKDFFHPSLVVALVANGRDVWGCTLHSEGRAYEPPVSTPASLLEDGNLLVDGFVDGVDEEGANTEPILDAEYKINFVSQESLASRRVVTETFAAGTSFATIVNTLGANYLSVFGVSVGSIPSTPVLTEDLIIKNKPLTEVLDTLSTWSGGYLWSIKNLVLNFQQPSIGPAPFDITDSDNPRNTIGGVKKRTSQKNKKNTIIVTGGTPGFVDTFEAFVGDGVTSTFQMKYPIFGPIKIVSATLDNAIGNAVIDYGTFPNSTSTESLGEINAPSGFIWEYSGDATHQITRRLGPVPLGVTFYVHYHRQTPIVVTAIDAVDVALNGPNEVRLDYLDIIVEDELQRIANVELERSQGNLEEVWYRTFNPGMRIGQVQNIQCSDRAIDGAYLIVEVRARSYEGQVEWTVRGIGGSRFRGSFRELYTAWLRFGGGAASSSPIVFPPGGAGAVGPAPPPTSVQWNNYGAFGGAYNVLYGDLFWDQPDAFLGEVKNQGLVFVAGSNGIAVPPAGTDQPGGHGPAGFVGLTDPYRWEFGILGSGDLSLDGFGGFTSDKYRVPVSFLLNAPGDINLTAGLSVGSVGLPQYGGVAITGNQSIANQQAITPGSAFAPGFSVIPGALGDSFSRLNQLTILEGVASFYQTISSLASPYVINTTTSSNTNEFLGFISTAGTGTIRLPFHGSAGSPDYRIFPNTACGRLIFIKNKHASGTVTVDAATAGSNIDTAGSITLGPWASVLLQRHDTGWTVISAFGAVSGTGSGAAAPGSDKDVIINDGGFFGVDTGQFTYDKTKDQLALAAAANNDNSQLRLTHAADLGGIIAIQSGGVTLGAYYGEIAFGRELIGGVDTARRANPSFIWAQDVGANPSETDGIGFEVVTGESAGSAMNYATGVGAFISEVGIFDVYQYGGLGTGNKQGMGVRVENNSSGNGAAAWFAARDKNGVARYLWPDATGAWRTATAPPDEDGTPADTSGNVLGGAATIITALSADPGSPTNGDVWVRASGTTPTRLLELRIRDGGVSYTIAGITI